jgi:hypothetical protein
MPDESPIEILKQGARRWNAWRQYRPPDHNEKLAEQQKAETEQKAQPTATKNPTKPKCRPPNPRELSQ